MNKNNAVLAIVIVVLVVVIGGMIESMIQRVSEVQALEDRSEIEALTTTYAWSIDKKDIDGLIALFIAGEPGDELFPVYDISPLEIPGLSRVEGVSAIRRFLEEAVIPAEPWTFSSISNVKVHIDSDTSASGGDYYIHEGYIPAEVEQGQVVRIYNQFKPETHDLLCKPMLLVRSVKIGQHQYQFAKDSVGRWKIKEMLSSPVFAAKEEIIGIEQISPAKKPWHKMFDDLASCRASI